MEKEVRPRLWGDEEMPTGLNSTCPLVKERIILFFPKIFMYSMASDAVKVKFLRNIGNMQLNDSLSNTSKELIFVCDK